MTLFEERRGELASYLLGGIRCPHCHAPMHSSTRECPECRRCADCGLRGCYSEACAEAIGIRAGERHEYLAGLARFGAFVVASLPRAAGKREAA